MMRAFNRLTNVLAFAAVVVLGHPDTASAQSLTFSPNPVVFTIAGPGGTAAAQTITITSSAGSNVNFCPCNTSTQSGSGNWLVSSGFTTGNTFTLSIDGGVTANLAPNTTYTGSVFVNQNGSTANGNLPVTLQVGG